MTPTIDMVRTAIDTASTEAATPPPFAAALRSLCLAMPSAAWRTKRRSGWRCTHYADPNARGGEIGYVYEAVRGLLVRAPTSCDVGGQNRGRTVTSNGGLWLSESGCLYRARIAGSWSNWQGSTSAYEITWRSIGVDDLADDEVEQILTALRHRALAFRDRCRGAKQRGAAEANAILAALESAHV